MAAPLRLYKVRVTMKELVYRVLGQRLPLLLLFSLKTLAVLYILDHSPRTRRKGQALVGGA